MPATIHERMFFEIPALWRQTREGLESASLLRNFSSHDGLATYAARIFENDSNDDDDFHRRRNYHYQTAIDLPKRILILARRH